MKRSSGRSYKRKSYSNAEDWSSIELENNARGEGDTPGYELVDDGANGSQSMVRDGRFCGSYMMATNGGATYEDILRPVANSAKPLPRSERRDSGEPDSRTGNSPMGLENVLGDSDERRIIADTSRIPARSVGLLRILPEDGTIRYGTAWLIGPAVLATAAHNLVHPEAGRTRKLSVGLAYDGESARGGWHKAVDCRFSKGWEESMRVGSPYDFAVIKTEDKQVGRQLGWFGFADYEDRKFDNMIVNIIGYPMDLKRFHMYGVAGRVLDVDSGRVFYDCDTCGGMSGGPVIARFGEQRVAVGVHVAGGARSNMATRLNDVAYALFSAHRDW